MIYITVIISIELLTNCHVAHAHPTPSRARRRVEPPDWPELERDGVTVSPNYVGRKGGLQVDDPLSSWVGEDVSLRATSM